MKLDIIIFIVIVVIVCLGSIWAWCDDISCKVWAEQLDDLDKKLEYSKLGLIYPPNNDKDVIKIIEVTKEENLKLLNKEKERVLNDMMCSSIEFEVALDQMRDCMNKPIMTPNEMRKMLGLDELEEVKATTSDITIGPATIMNEEEEPKSKKLEPLVCKMCGGTVTKNGDIYECEYCGLHYEWR